MLPWEQTNFLTKEQILLRVASFDKGDKAFEKGGKYIQVRIFSIGGVSLTLYTFLTLSKL